MRKLVFATNNAHKLEEIRAILGEKVEILSLKDIHCDTDIPETRHHPAVSTVAGIGVDGGTYGMAGAGTFGCGQAFCR